MSVRAKLEEATRLRRFLREDEMKDLLRGYGVSIPRHFVVEDENDLKKLEVEFPAVLKLCSYKVLHKSDVGGVVLNIPNMKRLREELRRFRERFPGESFLVEEMARPGIEMIAGLLWDDIFGLSIMVGVGGIFTELYNDASFRVIPISRGDAEGMLDELKGRRLFEGFRGMRADREAVVDLLLRLSRLGEDLGEYIDQMDLNPIVVYEKGLIVVDAKLILKQR